MKNSRNPGKCFVWGFRESILKKFWMSFWEFVFQNEVSVDLGRFEKVSKKKKGKKVMRALQVLQTMQGNGWSAPNKTLILGP